MRGTRRRRAEGRRNALPTVKFASTRKMKLRTRRSVSQTRPMNVARIDRTHPKRMLKALSSSLPRRSMKKTS